MEFTGVYTLTNPRTGEFYVGSSKNIKKRCERHTRELILGNHHCSLLQKVWNKNNNLVINTFPTETREEAYVLEQDFFDRYKDSPLLLNIVLQAKGGDTLTRDPNRTQRIEKIKQSVINRMLELTKEEKSLLFGLPGSKNGMWGKTHTEEMRRRFSEMHKGNKYNLGAVFSEEHRRKISVNASKRVGELNGFYGKAHSEETRKRISEAKKANPILPPNTRKVKVDDKVYESLTEASRQLNISPALMVYRINSTKDKYSGYCYLN
jgi:group I intron endonuclease